MSDAKSHADGREVENRLRALGAEITSMYREICWLTMQMPDKPTVQTMADIDLNVLSALKAAVDDFRNLLWKYLESAAKLYPKYGLSTPESHKFVRGTQLQQLLRERILDSENASGATCFFEAISATIQQLEQSHAENRRMAARCK